MNTMSIDQRKSLAREASDRDVSAKSLLTAQFPGMEDHTLAPMVHEVEWELVAQSMQRTGNAEEGCAAV